MGDVISNNFIEIMECAAKGLCPDAHKVYCILYFKQKKYEIAGENLLVVCYAFVNSCTSL